MTPYQIILALTTIFLFGYWTGIFLLSYHLIRFGIGTHPRRVALIMILGSVFLTILAIMLTITIK
jgi:Na+/H+ antiporter NhaA